MQVFRLVEPGRVDRVIAFDELPKRLLAGVRRVGIEGFPRHWWNFFKLEKTAKSPEPFYRLEYTQLNADKERWQEICSYVRSAADKKVRLLDKLEDMAIPMAPDSYSQMTIEPEDITTIPVPKEEEEESPLVKAVEKKVKEVPEEKEESASVETPKKKPGRPKKSLTMV